MIFNGVWEVRFDNKRGGQTFGAKSTDTSVREVKFNNFVTEEKI